jgi:hypothetical protein
MLSKQVRYHGDVWLAVQITEQIEIDFYPDGGGFVLHPGDWILHLGSTKRLVVSDEQLHYQCPAGAHYTIPNNEFEIIE